MKTCDTECVAPSVLNLGGRWQVASSPDRLVPGDGPDAVYTSSNLLPAVGLHFTVVQPVIQSL